MKHLWIILFCFLTSANAEVYRWFDKNGYATYSDEYHPDAEVVRVDELPTYTPVPIQQPTISVTENEIDEEASRIPDYQVEITAPEHDKTVRVNNGNVLVNVDIQPELNSERGDKIIAMVDGQQQGEALAELSFTLTNVDRGTHTLTVSVVDSSNKVLKLSKSVTFHLQRVSTAP
ncbi:MAG: DUF4124 domain-containing protein [Methylophaga sp.]|nr:MAG: DUF4124 domain-containing protein [Methylophaga sp.]